MRTTAPNSARRTPGRARPAAAALAVTRRKEQRLVKALRYHGIYLLWELAVFCRGRLSPLPQLWVVWRSDVEGRGALETTVRVGLYEPRGNVG